MLPRSAEVVCEVEACWLALSGNLCQLGGNEKHLEQENVERGWLVTFQANGLLVRVQTLEETQASFLLVHLVTP